MKNKIKSLQPTKRMNFILFKFFKKNLQSSPKSVTFGAICFFQLISWRVLTRLLYIIPAHHMRDTQHCVFTLHVPPSTLCVCSTTTPRTNRQPPGFKIQFVLFTCTVHGRLLNTTKSKVAKSQEKKKQQQRHDIMECYDII